MLYMEVMTCIARQVYCVGKMKGLYGVRHLNAAITLRRLKAMYLWLCARNVLTVLTRDYVQEVCWQLWHTASCWSSLLKKSPCRPLDSSANTHYTSRDLECHDVTQEYSQLYEFKSLQRNTRMSVIKFCAGRILRNHSRCVPIETTHTS